MTLTDKQIAVIRKLVRALISQCGRPVEVEAALAAPADPDGVRDAIVRLGFAKKTGRPAMSFSNDWPILANRLSSSSTSPPERSILRERLWNQVRESRESLRSIIDKDVHEMSMADYSALTAVLSLVLDEFDSQAEEENVV